MTLAESVKITRALELMSSLERLKQERRFCNFTVKVDNHSFEVDKNVMVASSPYFEALFSSQMGEVNAGVVDMKEVDANAIKLSIGFFYSGEAKLDMDSIQHVLHAGNLLQIPLLLNLCFGHMQDHLSPQNCIKVMLLADTYSHESLNKKAYEVLTSKLKDVINSDTLPNLCRRDFKFVTDAIFFDIGKLEEEIGDDVDVCFKLKKILEILGNDASAKDSILIKFFVKNAANLFQGTEFLDMNNSFVENIIQEGNCSEELKYEALLRWTKHVKKRKKHFSKLFKFIKLETLPLEFLKQKIQSEKLVEDFPESYKSLMNAVFQIAEKKDSELELLRSTPSNTREKTPSGAEQVTSTSSNFRDRAPNSVGESSNLEATASSRVEQMLSTSTSSNSGEDSSGANQVPSSNPSSTKICRECAKPILHGVKWYFECCKVYVHDDCLKWISRTVSSRTNYSVRAYCPQCKGISSPTRANI